MTVFLNLALLIIGTTATLCAFGGRTWHDGPEPILERITSRGWISITCLVLAFALGAAKEVHTEHEDEKKKTEADRKQAELTTQLAAAKAREDLANQRLDDLQKIDKLTQERLDETKVTLNDVRGNLKTTRDDLSQQSAASLVTSLANSNQNIRDILFFLPLTAQAHPSTKFREALLPSFAEIPCQNLTGLSVGILTQAFHYEHIIYEPGDVADEHEYFKETIPKADALWEYKMPEDMEDLRGLKTLADQTSSNRYAYFAAIHTRHSSISAAQLYAMIMKPSSDVAYISIAWPTPFKTNSFDQAAKSYPDILGDIDISKFDLTEDGVQVDIAKQHPYPASCLKLVQRYFSTAFRKAVLVLVIDQKQNETIVIKLKARPPELHHGLWEVTFGVDSTPMFMAFEESFLKDRLILDWPDSTPEAPVK